MSIIQGTSKAAGGLYTIEQSIRFDKTTSSHLSKTYGSAGNRRTWTFSTWFKRGKIDGSRQVLFAATGLAYLQIGPDAASREMITILNEGTGTDLNWYTTAVYRDPSAWYHLVWQFDSTQATADNRTKLYINGVQVTDFTKAATPDLNLEGAINNNVEHKIGEGHIANFYFDGLQSEIHFIDGTALDPTSFGEVNDDGVWVPIEYTGTYGTNGFYITGADSADLGADYSGNSNDFTSSGLTSADQMLDTPTANHCTLNPLWVDGYTLSDGNLITNQSGDAAAIGTMAFDPTDSDGFYFEAKVTTAATYPNVGIRTAESFSQIGAVSNLSGNSTGRFAYTGSNGQFNDEGSGSSYGDAWSGTADKVIGVLVKGGSLYFSVDGTIQNSGTAAKTGLTGLMVPTVFYDAGSGTQAAWEMRFAEADWGTTPPAGYKALSTANLPDPIIALPTDYFNVVLDTGANIKTTAEALYTDQFEWIKDRDNANNHQLIDSVRGTSAVLQSNTSIAETTYSAPSGNSVGWVWKANGAGSSNTDGTVSSTVSANTTAGFAIAKWTHTTASNYTVGHGLGAVPKMIIVKTTDQGTNWGVYHSDITVGNRLILNSTSGQTTGYWGANSWTSSTFSIGTARDTNGSTMIAYCFAEVENFSSFGIYTGNGSTDGPFVYTNGFAPAFVMTKRTNAAGDWKMWDNKRGPYNVNGLTLAANSSGAESSGVAQHIDFLSNGFKIRGNDTETNGSGSTYIFMAVAESPFQTTTAR